MLTDSFATLNYQNLYLMNDHFKNKKEQWIGSNLRLYIEFQHVPLSFSSKLFVANCFLPKNLLVIDTPYT